MIRASSTFGFLGIHGEILPLAISLDMFSPPKSGPLHEMYQFDCHLSDYLSHALSKLFLPHRGHDGDHDLRKGGGVAAGLKARSTTML
jgi:hypothetical protein